MECRSGPCKYCLLAKLKTKASGFVSNFVFIFASYRPKPQGSVPKGKKSKVNFQQAESKGSEAIVIPPCSCGAERQFEYQIMPSLLHVLEVDKHATQNQDNPSDLDAIMSADYGGMNWGTIAVYTCPKTDCCTEDFLWHHTCQGSLNIGQ